jgi:hypothetical protein
MKKFTFEPAGQNAGLSVSQKIDSLYTWAKQIEASIESISSNHMLLIVGFDALVETLIEKGLITPEELTLAREKKLEALQGVNKEESKILVPRTGIISPSSD